MIQRYPIILLILFNLSPIFAFHNYQAQDGNVENNEFRTTINQDSVIRNQMWEVKLFSTNSYTNPYKDVVLSLHISNADSSTTFDSYGFWDGDSTFIIRSSFPSTGQWSWKTTCSITSDAGLHNQSGIVSVSEYNGTNKIYKHGGLKISSNNKYLTYGDDTPFLWMGGTAWGLPMVASFEEWKTYIDDRHSKKFNIVQIAPARAHGGIWLDPPIIYPTNWKGDVCFFSDDKWDPLYWQELDRFIEYANSKDIVVVVVGLAEPVYDILTEEDAKLFARNFSARVEGFHVILSPAFDTWQPFEYSILDSTGEALNNSRHLISQHTGHSYANAELNEHSKFFRDRGYLDFSMNQTGHNGGDLERCYKKAKQWNINLLDELPMKPVINTEVLYSAGTYADQITDNEYERQGTDENARQLGWLSLVSGSLGYTYGTQGIWNYGEQVDSSINLTIPLNDAINFESSAQMEYLVNFFSSIDWWELEPIHSAIKSSETDETKKMALAVSENGSFGVAYLPNNNEITIDVNIFSNKINGSWFNPITGIFSDGDQNVPNSGEHTFIPPTAGEWALLLQKEELTLSIDYNQNWNLISVPLSISNMNVDSIFSESMYLALKFDSIYTNVDILDNGVGYWIKNSIGGSTKINGSKPDEPINIKKGWNLIGVYDKELSIDQIQTTPEGIICNKIYGFENGYHVADKFDVGKGYWVKANREGEIRFADTSLLGKSKSESDFQTEPFLSFNVIATDENSDSISLTFGLDSLASNNADSTFGEMELPPLPPNGVFDIRVNFLDTVISSYTDIRFLSADCYEHVLNYQLADSSDGLTLSWDLPEGVLLNISDMIDGTIIDESFESGIGSLKISNPNMKNIKLTFCYSAVVLSNDENIIIPNSYSLLQNYPNPFNPSTKIKFGLPKESLTSLIVYNILGEQVAVLLDKKLKIGYHEVEFNNFNHSSGIYFYRLQAGDFVETKKMILLK